MTLIDPNHVEYVTYAGFIQVIMDNGQSIPAYWAHPKLGGRYPAITLLHDWWGMTSVVRYLASKFAQLGYYVIAPDLFDGQLADTPKRAMELVGQLNESEARMRVNTALDVVERHHQCNRQTAVIGLGMGGGLAFGAGILRGDLEAVVTFGAFPQVYFGRFAQCKAPILAFYGSNEPLIEKAVIERLRAEFLSTPLRDQHRVETITGLAHDFFDEDFTGSEVELSKEVMTRTVAFLQSYLKGPVRPPQRQVI